MSKWEELLEQEKLAEKNVKKFAADVNLKVFWTNALMGFRVKKEHIKIADVCDEVLKRG